MRLWQCWELLLLLLWIWLVWVADRTLWRERAVRSEEHVGHVRYRSTIQWEPRHGWTGNTPDHVHHLPGGSGSQGLLHTEGGERRSRRSGGRRRRKGGAESVSVQRGQWRLPLLPAPWLLLPQHSCLPQHHRLLLPWQLVSQLEEFWAVNTTFEFVF